MENGFNPMRYNCEKQGCFNQKRRPKIEMFAASLPGKIAFTDIDACCEINGNQLWLEFKSYEGEINNGQRRLFLNQTSSVLGKFNRVFVVVGNAETMIIESVMVFGDGDYTPFEPCDLAKLKSMVKEWADKAYDLTWQLR